MLVRLRVKDLAIIDEQEIAFGAGFNVLTGETGAGKSLLGVALGLLLGGKASKEVIRADCGQAVVEGFFEPVPEEIVMRSREFGIEVEEGLLLRRVILRSGRSMTYVNGNLFTLSNLTRLTRGMVDIVSQMEHHSLLNPEHQLEYLDAYASLASQLEKTGEAYDALMDCAEALKKRQGSEQERLARIDYLGFQLKEITEAGLKPGEDSALEGESRKLRHAEALNRATRLGEQRLYAQDGAVVDVLAQVQKELGELVDKDPELAPLVLQIGQAREEIVDAAAALRDYADGVDADPSRLEAVENRLNSIRNLSRKYGASVDAILAKASELEAELKDLEQHEENMAELRSRHDAACGELAKHCRILSAARLEAGGQFQKAVEQELAGLQMAETLFQVSLKPRLEERGGGAGQGIVIDNKRTGRKGWDGVEFLIAPNPGEGLRPLAKIASGGELSRIALAVRRVLAKNDPVDTHLFDEIDAGIGGEVAELAGRKLREVSRHHQVLCITHLPQIACFADRHYLVKKVSNSGRTTASVKQLNHEDRIGEVARMLAGARISTRSKAHAEEMIRLGAARTA